jgi:hypothetical protein
MTIDAWTIDRIAHLKGLKNRTEQQDLMVMLAEKNEPDANDKRKLGVLVRAEKAAVRAIRARQVVNNLLGAEQKAAKEAERKARNHRLIQQGLLIDFATLESWDRGELLGALLNLRKSESIPTEKRAEWKRHGDALLAAKVAAQ